MNNTVNHNLKTRFCPSPTGLIHLGNARTALFSYLLARGQAGCFLLRIEDTDAERSKPEFVEKLERDLRWLGLDWSEGPEKGGGAGPYYQSERQEIYNNYYEKLIAHDLVYPCFCSQEQLKLARRIQRSAGKPPRYPGTCSQLTETQRQEKIEEGIQPTLRFRVPKKKVLEFTDLVRGEQKFLTEDIGDFIIRRADGTSPFMFCNAIDDALMGVTHVLRGEDHLTNTPRQIMILQALALPAPTYGHISLIVGLDGSPLSKRHGSRSIEELNALGYLPLAIDNYMARLGHYYGHDRLQSLDELAAQFKFESLSRSPAKFNPKQLDYWQKETIAVLNNSQFWQWVGGEVKSIVPANMRDEFVAIVKTNVHFPQDVKRWAEIIFQEEFQVSGLQREILKEAGNDYFDVCIEGFKIYKNDAHLIIDEIKTKLNLKGKALYQPLRVALTGELHGPELQKIITLMKPEEVYRRLEGAKK